jgi:hypothetical protein
MGDGGHCGLFLNVSGGFPVERHLHLPCTLAGPSVVAILFKGLVTTHSGLRKVNGRQGTRALSVELRRGRENGRVDCLSVHVMCLPCLLDFTLLKSLILIDSFNIECGNLLGCKMTEHGSLAVL